jgi:hypothetical protein
MARATLGVCLGTCLGISGAFAATWLSMHSGIDAAWSQRVACYGLFSAACGYASIRPIPRAAVELLLAIAALTIGVALADLIDNASMFDTTPQSRAVLGVDLAGLAMGAGFAALARAAARRARHGDPHSVWALARTL